jgi:glycosyltransferase involved in cell wall biosynthesis/protein-tyrosine-phosphatase
MSADLWAGAEVQVATALSWLVQDANVRVSAVLFNDGRLAAELQALGIDVEVVDERRHGACGILAFLARFLRDRRIDIVHTHRYKDTLLGVMAAKLAGVPHVVRTVHGLAEPMRGWESAKLRAYTAMDRTALRWAADRVVAVSRELADHLGQVRARRPRDEVRGELGIDGRTLLIGTAGRLFPVKGQDDLVRAAELILRERSGARFLFVGGGPLRGELQARAAQLGIEHACRFVGERPDVHDLVAAMDIFVLPSLHEGIPMALLEAMALGRPAVASAVGGVPEVIGHHLNGLLVKPRRPHAIAAACLELAGKPEWSERVGLAGRRTVEAAFSHDISGRALVDEYRAVAARPAGPEPTAHGRRASSGPRTAAETGALRLAWELTRGLLSIAGRRLNRMVHAAAERQRMKRIRQRPARLTQALHSASRVLIVCQGNVIRSPFAAYVVAQAVGHRGVSISSGGLAAVAGRHMHPTALQLARSRQIDLRGHSASPVRAHDVAASDVIFVMDIPQLVLMRARFPSARGRTFLLTCLAADAPLEIADPVGGDDARFEACFDHICRAVRPIVGALAHTAPVQ